MTLPHEDQHKWLDRKNMPKKRKRPRRCKHCKMLLSIYNHNDYCHAHRAQGIKANYKRLADEAYRKHEIQRKYLKKKQALRKKEKENAKLLARN